MDGDNFPPIFNQFREFYEEQRGVLLDSFEKQRTELFEQFTNIVNEKDEISRELFKTKKDLKESREILEENEKIENEEVEELEMRLRIASASMEKKEEAEKESKLRCQELEIKQNIGNRVLEKLKNDVNEFEKSEAEIKVEIVKLRKEKEMSHEKFNHELKNLEEQKNKTENNQKELIVNLEEDIKQVKVSNEEKDSFILKQSEECDKLKHTMELLEVEKENKLLKEMSSKLDSSSQINDGATLYEELKHSDFIDRFKCKSCGKTYLNKLDMEDHFGVCTENEHLEQRVSLSELERNLVNLRIHTAKSIFKLKEKELVERASCNCKRGCRIYHFKHNWYRIKSRDFLDALDNGNTENSFEEKIETGAKPKVYTCKFCNITFTSRAAFNHHMEPNHMFKSNETEKNIFITETKAEIEIPLKNEDNDETEGIFLNDQVSSDEKNVETDQSTEVFKNLCLVCLLSFKTEKELNEHTSKHSEGKTLPSILKNK